MSTYANKEKLFRRAIEIKTELIREYERYYRGETEGHCPHGVYVGGCGADYMCGYCESNYSILEYALIVAYDERRRERNHIDMELVKKIMSGFPWEHFDQRESHEIYKRFVEIRDIIRSR